MLANTTFFDIKNTFMTETTERKYSLSNAIVETLLLAMVSVLGINTIVVLIAQLMHIPFIIYLIICPIVSLLAILCTGWICLRKLKNIGTKDYSVLVKLSILSLISATMILLAPHTIDNMDNYLYIPNAVYFLSHPNQPMDFQIHFFVGEGDKPIISPSQATSLAYEYFRAAITHYLHVPYTLIYFYSGMIMALFLPFAYFLLITYFVEDNERAIWGTIVSVALILMSGDGQRTHGSLAFAQADLGKFLFLSIGVPLFAAYSMAFFQNQSKMNWLNLLLCTMTFVGMTTSATVLIVILALLLLSTTIIVLWINTRPLDWKKTLLKAGLYISSLTFIFAYLLFLFWMQKSGTATVNYATLNVSTEFINQLITFSNLQWPLERFPLTLLLMSLSPLFVFVFLKKSQRQFFLLWMILVLVLFLNPVSMNLFSDTLVPSNIYWRLFFLFPFPISIAVAVTKLQLPSKTKLVFEIGIILLAFTIYRLLKPNMEFSPNQIAFKNAALAHKVVAIAPHGLMLTPPILYGTIPMIDGFHPQISTRIDALELWLSNPKESPLRMKASLFAEGDTTFFEEFSTLIKDTPIKTVVLKRTIFQDPIRPKVLTFLKKNGFIHKKYVGHYIVFWK